MFRLLSWFIDCPRDSNIDWNIDNAWAEGIISVEVNTTVPRAVTMSVNSASSDHWPLWRQKVFKLNHVKTTFRSKLLKQKVLT